MGAMGSDDDVAANGRGLPRLLAITARLRDPERGCPWDVEQDFASIAPYTIEEAYEVADAIEREAWDELRGELGDLLLQVVYHAQMASERGWWGFDAVADEVARKMWDRHPHVFGDQSRDKSAAQQVADWETAKAAERRGRALDGVALGLPALMRAQKLQKRVARVGFDWPDVEGPLGKVAEEAREVAAARGEGPARVAEEVGDLLFSVVNLARHLGVDAEEALRGANAKFHRRFEAVEDALGGRVDGATLEEMDAAWDAVRRG